MQTPKHNSIEPNQVYINKNGLKLTIVAVNYEIGYISARPGNGNLVLDFSFARFQEDLDNGSLKLM